LTGTAGSEWPNKKPLLAYFHEVRVSTKDRLEQTCEEEFDRMIADEHFGSLTVRQVWAGSSRVARDIAAFFAEI
jgi:hypothetical protein